MPDNYTLITTSIDMPTEMFLVDLKAEVTTSRDMCEYLLIADWFRGVA